MVALLLMRVAVLFLVSDDKKKHHNGDDEVEMMVMLKKVMNGYCSVGKKIEKNIIVKRSWFNGRMHASHACDPGPIPGGRILFFGFESIFCFCEMKTSNKLGWVKCFNRWW